MAPILAMVRRVAAVECNVLLVGEPGTGRDMIAHAIHVASPWADEPYEAIDCDGLETRRLQPLGSTSTIFLRNVVGMAATSQRDLSHLLEPDEEFSTRGRPGRRFRRVIASATPGIDRAVDRDRFRRDLFAVLSTVRLDMPPLRERKSDVPHLAAAFLEEACERHALAPKSFANGALVLLSALPWPGNVRELRALTERLALLARSSTIMLEHVLEHVRLDQAVVGSPAGGSLRDARATFERGYVTAVLRSHRGRMGPAAKELGMEENELVSQAATTRNLHSRFGVTDVPCSWMAWCLLIDPWRVYIETRNDTKLQCPAFMS